MKFAYTVVLAAMALLLSAGAARSQEAPPAEAGDLAAAHKLREGGKSDEALAKYRLVAERKDTPAHDRGGARLWIAHLLREKKDREGAAKMYAEVAAMTDAHPHDRGGAQMWVAHLLREGGKAWEALAAYAAVLKIEGIHPHDRGGAQTWLGVLHFEQAKSVLSEVAKSDTAHPGDKKRAQEVLDRMK